RGSKTSQQQNCLRTAVGSYGADHMIVREIMTTNMITVAPDDTLGHAAHLLRQYQFHHLPVVRQTKAAGAGATGQAEAKTPLLFEGLITSQDIDLAVALGKQRSSGDLLQRPWHE